MSNRSPFSLLEPEIKEAGPLLLAGARDYVAYSEISGVPRIWERLFPHLEWPRRVDACTYGACFAAGPPGEGTDYLAAIAVESLEDLPKGLVGASLPAKRYSIFPHEGHVSTISETSAAIMDEWLPRSGEQLDDGELTLLERYGEAFDPVSGRGGIELWVPLAD